MSPQSHSNATMSLFTENNLRSSLNTEHVMKFDHLRYLYRVTKQTFSFSLAMFFHQQSQYEKIEMWYDCKWDNYPTQPNKGNVSN